MGRRRQRPGGSMHFPGLVLCWLQRVTGGGNSDLRELTTVLTLSPNLDFPTQGWPGRRRRCRCLLGLTER